MSTVITIPLIIDHSRGEWVTVGKAAERAKISEKAIRQNQRRYGRKHFGKLLIFVPALMAADDATVVREE